MDLTFYTWGMATRPMEVVDMADVAGETNKYMDIVDTVDRCRVPTGLSERSIGCTSSIKGG